MARRLLLALVLALGLAMVVAGTSSAIAGLTRPGDDLAASHSDAVSSAQPAAREPPAPRDDGSSPIVPLVFAGIVILAAAGPWVPPGSRFTSYRIERRW